MIAPRAGNVILQRNSIYHSHSEISILVEDLHRLPNVGKNPVDTGNGVQNPRNFCLQENPLRRFLRPLQHPVRGGRKRPAATPSRLPLGTNRFCRCPDVNFPAGPASRVRHDAVNAFAVLEKPQMLKLRGDSQCAPRFEFPAHAAAVRKSTNAGRHGRHSFRVANC